MKRFVVVGAIVLGVFSLANLMRAQDLSAAYTLPQLQAQIAAQLAQPRFAGALWGVKVVALDSGQTIFAEHADRLMTPASNTKLYTAALGLDQLGGDYRFETPVYAFGKIGRNGTLRGDLCVVGQGDPSWNQRRLGTNFWAIFEPFVRVIIQAGVRRVNGDLLADTTFFHGPPTGAGWQIDDLRAGNVGLLSALSLNDNLAQVRVEPGAQPGWPCQVTLLQPGTGLVLSNLTTTVARNLTPHIELFPVPETSVIDVLGQLPVNADRGVLDVAVPRPADWFAAGLKLALARSGVLVTGRVRVFSWPETPGRDARATTKLGTVSSPPLREVVAGFMKPSQNLETDLLLAAVGEKLRAGLGILGCQRADSPDQFPGQSRGAGGGSLLQRGLRVVTRQSHHGERHGRLAAIHGEASRGGGLSGLPAGGGRGWHVEGAFAGSGDGGQCPRQNRHLALGQRVIGVCDHGWRRALGVLFHAQPVHPRAGPSDGRGTRFAGRAAGEVCGSPGKIINQCI